MKYLIFLRIVNVYYNTIQDSIHFFFNCFVEDDKIKFIKEIEYNQLTEENTNIIII